MAAFEVHPSGDSFEIVHSVTGDAVALSGTREQAAALADYFNTDPGYAHLRGQGD